MAVLNVWVSTEKVTERFDGILKCGGKTKPHRNVHTSEKEMQECERDQNSSYINTNSHLPFFSYLPGAVNYTTSNNNYGGKSDLRNQQAEEPKIPFPEDEDEEEERSSSFRRLVTNFAASTTAHGVANIAAAKSLPKRMVWLVVTVALYAVLLLMCCQLIVRYLKKPVVSRMEMSFEESLDFPTVTICNLNMLRRNLLQRKGAIYKIVEEMEKRRLEEQANLASSPLNTTNTTYPSIETAMKVNIKEQILAKARTSEDREILAHVGIDNGSLERNLLDMTMKSISEDELISLGHGQDEMIKYCRWSYYSCHRGSLKRLWRHFWHWKHGNCYVFNSGLSANGKKLPVMTTDTAGPYNGLEMDIFINQQEYTGLTDEAGVRVVLTDQGRMPFPFDEGFSVPTGFSTSVGIRKRYIKRVDPYLNNSCLDETRSAYDSHSDIYGQKYHVNYSCQACRMSCLATKQVEICNCSEPRFPINSSACFSLKQSECIRQVNAKFTTTGLDCVSKCPQPCTENVFSFTVSSARWSKAFSTMIRKKYKITNSFGNALLASENFLRLQIFYEDLSVSKTINEESYKLENLLADIGGQLGLWIGVSVMTGVEILEFISNLLTYLCSKRLEK